MGSFGTLAKLPLCYKRYVLVHPGLAHLPNSPLRTGTAPSRAEQWCSTYGINGVLHESFVHMRYIWLKSAISSDRRPADMRTLGYNQALPSNPGTQWVVVSAGIAQERVVMARSQMPDIDRMLQRPSGARMYE